ncbi:unnamed protein product, partial [Amoebophrya sp. A25]
ATSAPFLGGTKTTNPKAKMLATKALNANRVDDVNLLEPLKLPGGPGAWEMSEVPESETNIDAIMKARWQIDKRLHETRQFWLGVLVC